MRKSLPKASVGCDFRVPSEGEIIESLRALRDKGVYEAFFNLVLDSGPRVIEATEFLKLYNGGGVRLEAHDSFYVAQFRMLRGIRTLCSLHDRIH